MPDILSWSIFPFLNIFMRFKIVMNFFFFYFVLVKQMSASCEIIAMHHQYNEQTEGGIMAQQMMGVLTFN